MTGLRKGTRCYATPICTKNTPKYPIIKGAQNNFLCTLETFPDYLKTKRQIPPIYARDKPGKNIK